MILSISNIAWPAEKDEAVFKLMKKHCFSGLEIAPTRVFPDNPYEDLSAAGNWKEGLQERYGFVIPSMQSIWYGRKEKLFGTETEREILLSYTKKAVDFAQAIGCGNLVFGCPVNRAIPEDGNAETAVRFFREIGEYAYEHQTVLAIEANPPIYNTNFINTTDEAFDLVKAVDSKGCLLNLDLGTMIENEESVEMLRGKTGLINHVHISEPGLKPVRKRSLHKQLACLLRDEGYNKAVSIEMGRQEDMEQVDAVMGYVRSLFEGEC